MNAANHLISNTRISLEGALAASEARFYSLVQNSPDAIVVANNVGHILYVNPEAELMFGRAEGGLIGKHFGFPIVTGKSTEIEVLSRDKKPIVAEMRVVEADWDGELAFMCSIRDLSMRARLMSDLKRSNADLNNFASVVSKDIRAPLENIGLLAKWLKEDCSTGLTAEAIDDVQLIITETNRMQKMLEDLLTYSQVSAYQDMSVEVNLQCVLDEALVSLSSDVFRSGAEIEKCQLPTLQCNPDQMVVVFRHLISNAINHCSAVPRIRISCEEKTDSLVISVVDNGIGIDPDNWTNVFLPFNQLRLREDCSSAGVGLATCKKIIEQHDGELWLKSHVGEGSIFYIKMPLLNNRKSLPVSA